MQPFYLTLQRHRLLCAYFAAVESAGPREGVLLLPPFAEEMNQTRSFHAALGRHLGTLGHSVLNVDLSGTGDSSAEFRDATWEDWTAEIRAAAMWLQERVDRLSAVAIRSAALHAGALTHGDFPGLFRLALIDPILSGDDLLGEFLRARVVRAMFEGQRITLAAVRAELEAGNGVEVSGYELSSWLHSAMRSVRWTPDELAAHFEATFWITSRTAISRRGQGATRSAATSTNDRITSHFHDDDLLWANDRPEPPAQVLDLLSGFLAAGRE